jgi:hypothetical protein
MYSMHCRGPWLCHGPAGTGSASAASLPHPAQAVGRRLAREACTADLLRARLVCRHWRAALTPSLQHLSLAGRCPAALAAPQSHATAAYSSPATPALHIALSPPADALAWLSTAQLVGHKTDVAWLQLLAAHAPKLHGLDLCAAAYRPLQPAADDPAAQPTQRPQGPGALINPLRQVFSGRAFQRSLADTLLAAAPADLASAGAALGLSPGEAPSLVAASRAAAHAAREGGAWPRAPRALRRLRLQLTDTLPPDILHRLLPPPPLPPPSACHPAPPPPPVHAALPLRELELLRHPLLPWPERAAYLDLSPLAAPHLSGLTRLVLAGLNHRRHLQPASAAQLPPQPPQPPHAEAGEAQWLALSEPVDNALLLAGLRGLRSLEIREPVGKRAVIACS